MKQYYVLFDNHTDGMALYQELKRNGLSAVISPTPRSLSKCCGISLLITEDQVEQVEEIARRCQLSYLKIDFVERTFDNQRDQYC
ncbi:MAG: DUF3343 domain-containing protein [Lachnospiraceae bacterium]|nr:DUF3343 domain-containing protein [Lachnospiraceae bacterium]